MPKAGQSPESQRGLQSIADGHSGAGWGGLMSANYVLLLHYPLPTQFNTADLPIISFNFFIFFFPPILAVPLALSLRSAFNVRNMPVYYSRALHGLALLVWSLPSHQLATFPFGINTLIAVFVASHFKSCVPGSSRLVCLHARALCWLC